MKMIIYGENLHTFSQFKNAKLKLVPNIYLEIIKRCKKTR